MSRSIALLFAVVSIKFGYLAACHFPGLNAFKSSGLPEKCSINSRRYSTARHSRVFRIAVYYNQDRATERILEHKRAAIEAEVERLRREYWVALIDYERAELGRRDAA